MRPGDAGEALTGRRGEVERQSLPALVPIGAGITCSAPSCWRRALRCSSTCCMAGVIVCLNLKALLSEGPTGVGGKAAITQPVLCRRPCAPHAPGADSSRRCSTRAAFTLPKWYESGAFSAPRSGWTRLYFLKYVSGVRACASRVRADQITWTWGWLPHLWRADRSAQTQGCLSPNAAWSTSRAASTCWTRLSSRGRLKRHSVYATRLAPS